MFEEEGNEYQNSSGSSLQLRNNETVVSSLTEATYGSDHTSLMNPSSRYGGGAMSRQTLSGIQEEDDEYESLADDRSRSSLYHHSGEASTSMRSSLNHNSLHEGSVVSASSASYYSQRRRPNRHDNRFNTGNASVVSSATSSSRRRYAQNQNDASTINSSSVFNSFTQSQSSMQQQQQVIGNQRLVSHNPKAATQEVNVSEYQEAIAGSDETSPLPDEYYEDDSYTQFRRKAASDTTVTTTTGGDSSKQDSEVEMLSTARPDSYRSPLSLRRRWYSLVSVLAAFALAAVGLKVSTDSLSTTTALYHKTSSSHVSDYIPGYQFGGGLGGLTGGQDKERRIAIAYNQYGIQPQQQSSSQLRRLQHTDLNFIPSIVV